MPEVAHMYPLPRQLQSVGARRFGFHGLSYEFLIGDLARIPGANAADRRIIITPVWLEPTGPVLSLVNTSSRGEPMA
jgi:acetate kinase